MGARKDYKPIKDDIMQHVRENFPDTPFDITNLKFVYEPHGIGHRQLKTAMEMLIKDHCILRHGSYIGTHGGSPITTYVLGDPNAKPSKTKNGDDYRDDIEQRMEYMHECGRRLARALGLPVGETA